MDEAALVGTAREKLEGVRTVRLRIPARAGDVALARLALSGLAAIVSLSDALLADLKLALTEAVSNSVRHAYRDELGFVSITYELGPDVLAVEVVDDGEGFDPERPPLLEGDDGYSRKGPHPGEASYYYSRPHLAVSGTIERGQGKEQVTGSAWLDHEWSSDYLAPDAAGWDWCGINLENGGALMAFRIRKKGGGVIWAGGTLKTEQGKTVFTSAQVSFKPLRTWRSPRTSVEYPVAMRVTAGSESWDLEPLMNDQELDSRASTGTVYWEGAVRAMQGGKETGRGYLELTGYWKPLRM